MAFPQNPYHSLVKDYKLVSDSRSKSGTKTPIGYRHRVGSKLVNEEVFHGHVTRTLRRHEQSLLLREQHRP